VEVWLAHAVGSPERLRGPPNMPLEPTPLRGPAIVPFLKAGIGPTVFPLDRGGAAQRQAVRRPRCVVALLLLIDQAVALPNRPFCPLRRAGARGAGVGGRPVVRMARGAAVVRKRVVRRARPGQPGRVLGVIPMNARYAGVIPAARGSNRTLVVLVWSHAGVVGTCGQQPERRRPERRTRPCR